MTKRRKKNWNRIAIVGIIIISIIAFFIWRNYQGKTEEENSIPVVIDTNLSVDQNLNDETQKEFELLRLSNENNLKFTREIESLKKSINSLKSVQKKLEHEKSKINNDNIDIDELVVSLNNSIEYLNQKGYK